MNDLNLVKYAPSNINWEFKIDVLKMCGLLIIYHPNFYFNNLPLNLLNCYNVSYINKFSVKLKISNCKIYPQFLNGKFEEQPI